MRSKKITTFAKIIILIAVFNLIADTLRAATADSAFVAGIQEGVKALTNRIEQEGLNSKVETDYLLIKADEPNVLTENWKNLGVDFLSEQSKTELKTALSQFNRQYSNKGIKLYLFVGRYFLNYADVGIKDQEKAKQTLQQALQQKNEGKPVNTKDVLTKRVQQVIKEQFNAAVQATQNNAIVLFYIETVLAQPVNSEFKDIKEEKYFYLFASNNINDKLMQNKLQFNTYLSYFKDHHIASSLSAANNADDKQRQTLLKKAVEATSFLLSNAGDDYGDPYGYFRLARMPDAERPPFAKGYDFENTRQNLLYLCIKQLEAGAEYLGGSLMVTDEQKQKADDYSYAATVIYLQELWIAERTGIIENLLPVWGSGKRAWLHAELASGDIGPMMAYQNKLNTAVESTSMVVDVLLLYEGGVRNVSLDDLKNLPKATKSGLEKLVKRVGEKVNGTGVIRIAWKEGQTQFTTTQLTRIGTWVSEAEYNLMVSTKQLQKRSGGLTHVLLEGKENYTDIAGKMYVEFNIPANTTIARGSGKGWGIFYEPESTFWKFYNNKGLNVGQPNVSNIQIIDRNGL